MENFFCRLCKKSKPECNCGHILGYALIENDEDREIFERKHEENLKQEAKDREKRVFNLLGEINKIKFFLK